MSKQQTALRLALEALETCGVVDYEQDFDHEKVDEAITALREALAQKRSSDEQPAQREEWGPGPHEYHSLPAQQEPKKLKVTLEDRPIDIELAQYKQMFEAACSALGSIGDALGVDPEEGGAEPILAAISKLKSCSTCQALARAVMMDQTSHDTSSPAQRTWVGLTQDEFRDFASTLEYGTGGLIRAIEAKLKEKNNG